MAARGGRLSVCLLCGMWISGSDGSWWWRWSCVYVCDLQGLLCCYGNAHYLTNGITCQYRQSIEQRFWYHLMTCAWSIKCQKYKMWKMLTTLLLSVNYTKRIATNFWAGEAGTRECSSFLINNCTGLINKTSEKAWKISITICFSDTFKITSFHPSANPKKKKQKPKDIHFT